jgi:hypothetical protein
MTQVYRENKALYKKLLGLKEKDLNKIDLDFIKEVSKSGVFQGDYLVVPEVQKFDRNQY